MRCWKQHLIFMIELLLKCDTPGCSSRAKLTEQLTLAENALAEHAWFMVRPPHTMEQISGEQDLLADQFHFCSAKEAIDAVARLHEHEIQDLRLKFGTP